jgi:hypothetical protein
MECPSQLRGYILAPNHRPIALGFKPGSQQTTNPLQSLIYHQSSSILRSYVQFSHVVRIPLTERLSDTHLPPQSSVLVGPQTSLPAQPPESHSPLTGGLT